MRRSRKSPVQAFQLGKAYAAISPISFPTPATTDRREEFWRTFELRRGIKPDEDFSVTRMETQLQENLGIELKKQLAEYFAATYDRIAHFDERYIVERTPHSGYEEIASLLHGVFFQARISGYHSMDLAINIGGTDALKSLFRSDTEVLLMFLESYLPRAFQATFPAYSIKDRYQYQVELADTTRDYFEDVRPSSRTSGRFNGDIQTMKDASRYWKIANYTLVVPVVLALLVLYYSLSALTQERHMVDTRQSQIATQQTELILRYEHLADMSNDYQSMWIQHFLNLDTNDWEH